MFSNTEWIECIYLCMFVSANINPNLMLEVTGNNRRKSGHPTVCMHYAGIAVTSFRNSTRTQMLWRELFKVHTTCVNQNGQTHVRLEAGKQETSSDGFLELTCSVDNKTFKHLHSVYIATPRDSPFKAHQQTGQRGILISSLWDKGVIIH